MKVEEGHPESIDRFLTAVAPIAEHRALHPTVRGEAEDVDEDDIEDDREDGEDVDAPPTDVAPTPVAPPTA